MRIPILAAFLLIVLRLPAQDDVLPSLFDSLYHLQDVHLILTYPFDSLVKTNNEEIPATITIEHAGGKLLRNASMSINLRGKFRRMKCGMPPLLLNFKKSTLRELHLDPIDEVKLVTHCVTGPEGPENLQEELLCYQMYEKISPYAYRTIWLTVTYCDALHPDSCFTNSGFLIEPDKVLSGRLGVFEKRLYNVSEDSVHYESFASLTAFNFMIGNRDWDIVASRNAKLFFNPSFGKYIVIPYDFDYANIVGASYRRVTLTNPMKHPFDRIYDGYYFRDKCSSTLTDFAKKEKDIMTVIANAPNPLSKERREQISNYIGDWFHWVDKINPKELQYGVVCYYKGGLKP